MKYLLIALIMLCTFSSCKDFSTATPGESQSEPQPQSQSPRILQISTDTIKPGVPFVISGEYFSLRAQDNHVRFEQGTTITVDSVGGVEKNMSLHCRATSYMYCKGKLMVEAIGKICTSQQEVILSPLPWRFRNVGFVALNMPVLFTEYCSYSFRGSTTSKLNKDTVLYNFGCSVTTDSLQRTNAKDTILLKEQLPVISKICTVVVNPLTQTIDHMYLYNSWWYSGYGSQYYVFQGSYPYTQSGDTISIEIRGQETRRFLNVARFETSKSDQHWSERKTWEILPYSTDSSKIIIRLW